MLAERVTQLFKLINADYSVLVHCTQQESRSLDAGSKFPACHPSRAKTSTELGYSLHELAVVTVIGSI